jgi:hypothetical protein
LAKFVCDPFVRITSYYSDLLVAMCLSYDVPSGEPAGAFEQAVTSKESSLLPLTVITLTAIQNLVSLSIRSASTGLENELLAFMVLLLQDLIRCNFQLGGHLCLSPCYLYKTYFVASFSFDVKLSE